MHARFTIPSCAALCAAAPFLHAQDPEPEPALSAARGVLLSSHDLHSSEQPHLHGTGGWSAGRPDGHAPIGVMGDHVHGAGEWMLSLRAMRMHMQGMREGTDRISNDDVFGQGFLVTPTEMDMDMLMFGAMYAPTDEVTVMAMLPYLRNEMDHVTGMGGRFTTKSEGLGDVRVGALVSVYDDHNQRIHLNLGLSLPTGSIDERDDTPAMANALLPYPMQLGSGTYDLLPGVTYLGQREDWSWGAQVIPRFHLGENDRDYRRGNRVDATGWGARNFGNLSLSVRLQAAHWGNIHGADPELNPNVVPTADPQNQGGDRVDALFGINYYAQEGFLAGNRFALEVGAPVFEDLDGPQLETDWVATFGWQFAR